MEGFALFALLPLALASLAHRKERGTFAGLGFLAALAPVVASGLGSLIKSKQRKGEEKKQIEFARQQAEAEEAAKRAQFEAAQNSPQAAMQRLRFNTQLSKVLGRFGGREKTPGFLLNAFDTARKPGEYTPGAQFVAPQTSGGGFWGFAGGLADALSYLDTSRLGRGGRSKTPLPTGLAGAKPDPRTAAPSTPPFATTQLKRIPFL